MEFLERFLGYLAFKKKSKALSDEPGAILPSLYCGMIQLANQIERHAAVAPYTHVTKILKQMADEKRGVAKQLRDAFPGYYYVEPEVSEMRSGNNHWERLNRDLMDQRELETRLWEEGTVLAEKHPEMSSRLSEIGRKEAIHRETILDLLVKADPQAHQTNSENNSHEA